MLFAISFECDQHERKWIIEFITSIGFLTQTIILFVVKFLQWGRTGSWVLMIQHVLSTFPSPMKPANWRGMVYISFMSEPVGIPVINSKYFLSKAVPDLAIDYIAVISPLICSPLRNLGL